MGAEYDALLIELEFNVTGRFCLLAAMLADWFDDLYSSGVPFRIWIESMLWARLLVEEFLRVYASSWNTGG